MSEYFRKPIVKTLMLKGQEGQSIKDIKKTGTSGLIDTYTITLTDGTTSTFTVENGEGLQNLEVGGRNLYYLKDFSLLFKMGISSSSVKNGEITVTASSSDLFLRNVMFTGDVYNNSLGPLMYVEGASFVTVSISNSDFNKNFYNFLDKDKKALSQFVDAGYGITTLSDPSDAAYFNLRIGKGNAVAGTTYKTRVKVERGNIPTDWTPAPEDLETTAITNEKIDSICV